jgi:radical SAM protein with 4Fe4S-binding SPASM domain
VYPFSQLIIRPTGQISLCCNDAMGQYTLGDLSKEKLTELWYGEKYSQVRKLILESRQKIDLCKNCDNFGVEDPNDWLKGYSIGNNWDAIEKLV